MVNTNLNSGYFEVSGSGSNLYYKIQIEDAAALNGGTSPNGKWNYVTAPDSENRQNGFQGSGYYVYGSDTSTDLNGVNQNEILEFEIEVPTALIGKSMNFRVRASRDGIAASDQQNDLWLNVVHKDGSGSIEEFLTQTANEAEPTSKEFIKVFGGPDNGSWGYASSVDGAPDNFSAQIAFPEAGRYILQIAGRSQGFHIDFIELATGWLGSDTADSTFVPTDPQPVQLVNEIPDQTFADGTIDTFDLPTSTFFDRNGDAIAYQISATAANGSDVSGVTINETTGQISGLSTLAIDTYQLTITANDPHGAATDTFEIDIVDELALETLVIPIDTAADDYEQFGEGGSADLELGLNGSQQEVGIRFTGIDIPAGAEIANAFIRFTAFDTNAASASFTIGIEDSENAATFTSADDLLGRTTAAELDWSNVAAWTAGQTYNTPDLTALIQQAIGSDGVDDGALAFLINGTTPTSSRVAQTFGNGNAAELVIEFGSSTPATPPTSPTPTDPEFTIDDDDAPLLENLSVSVSLASDDYEQFGEGGSADLELGLNGSQQEVGIRFTGIDIPAGAEIANAFIRFTAFDTNAASASFTIGIEDSENAATFTSADDLLGRTTAAELDWSNVAAWTAGQTYNTPDLTALIQQAIGSDGVDDGALAFLINGTTPTSSRVAQTFGNGNAAELVIEFGSSTPATPTVPEVAIAATQDGVEGLVAGEFTLNLSQAVDSETIIDYSVAGSATADVDYAALSGSVTIPANQTSATIDVRVIDDELIEDVEDVTLTLDSVTAGDANVLLSAADMATIAIADNDRPLKTMLLEAETATEIVNYRTENIGVASGGVSLSFVGNASNEAGSAAFTFNGASGSYDVLLGTFDENDGVAQFTVDFSDLEVSPSTDSVSIVLDASLGSNVATASTFVELSVAAGINLTSGDIITVNGFENGSEHARLDYLKLVPTV